MDINKIRKDFAYLEKNNLIYFDSAATSQKPSCVVKAISDFYNFNYAPIHRGIYKQAEEATDHYESARKILAQFVDAEPEEIIFTQGTTASINFVAQAWAEKNLNSGDEIILTELEHHSNLLPWIRVSKSKNLCVKFIPINNSGELDYAWLDKNISSKTKLVAFTNCSNVLGTYVDAKRIIKKAKEFGAKTLIDMAQVAGYEPISLKSLNPDFAAFSGHKMLGPTGIGILYINKDIQNQVEPYQLGGGMVNNVSWCNFTPANIPTRFEAGTPPIIQAFGLAEACKYLNQFDLNLFKKHYAELSSRLIEGLEKLDGIKVLGPIEQLKQGSHIVSFISDRFHAHDIAAYLDSYNISIRAGTHCAQPLFSLLNIPGSARVSFYIYNTLEEVDKLLSVLSTLVK